MWLRSNPLMWCSWLVHSLELLQQNLVLERWCQSQICGLLSVLSGCTIATPEIRNSFSVVPVLPILFTDRPIYLWQCGVGPVHIVTGHENSSCDISDDLHNVKMIITNCRRNVPPCCFIYNLCLLGLHCVCTIRYNKWHGLSQLPIFVLHLHLQSIIKLVSSTFVYWFKASSVAHWLRM